MKTAKDFIPKGSLSRTTVLDLMEKYGDYREEELRKRAVVWSIDDFLSLEVEGYTINEEQAQKALKTMIYKHDATVGINWDVLDYWYKKFATKIES